MKMYDPNDYEAAEVILRRCVQDGTQPTFEELRFMSSKLGWESDKNGFTTGDVEKQLGRIRRVINLEAIAGTSTDRKGLAAESRKAAKALATKGPELESKIATLQAELKAYADAATSLERRIAEADSAVAALRELAPQHCVDNSNHLKRLAGQSSKREMLLARTELRHAEVLVNVPDAFKARQTYIDTVSSYAPKMTITTVKGQTRRRVLSEEWEAERKRIEAGLPKQRAEVARLEKVWLEKKSEAETLLNYYIR